MKKFLKTYKSVIILLAAIIIGAIVGIAFKEKAAVLKPFGDIFLNLLFVVIVPLIFLSITTSIAKIKQPKRLGKIMITIFCVFIVMSLVSVLVGVLSTYSFKLVNTDDGAKIRAELEEQSGTAETTETEDLNILERTVNVLTVSDFNKLLSKENIIAIVVFSIFIRNSHKNGWRKRRTTRRSARISIHCYVEICTINIVLFANRIGLLFCCVSWNLWRTDCTRIC